MKIKIKFSRIDNETGYSINYKSILVSPEKIFTKKGKLRKRIVLEVIPYSDGKYFHYQKIKKDN